ncbi:MAG: glycosyltransferase family 2 protein [Candidatus Levybacteria bacterium]|nr:glycosyltransferase family 2 protein [Candidatus Levybacteria bacterium]
MSKKIKQKLPSLTLSIPAYNEEDNLGLVIKNTVTNAPKFLSDFEIIIINDGSKDKTGEIADLFAKKYRFIRVIHQENKGYGEAMLRGIKEARKEFVAYMPADGQFLIEDMKYCLPLMRDADLILGARGSRADYTVYRLFLSYTYLIILKILFGISFQDVNWLNIWRTKEVQKLKISSLGIFLLAEIVIRFQKKRLIVVEAPSNYRPRIGGKAKNAKPSIALRTLFDALRLWLRLKFQ